MHPDSLTAPICRPLAEDAELAEAVAPDRRAAAIEQCVAPLITLPAGSWTPLAPASADVIGTLVLDGVLMRRLAIEDRFAIELLGEGDVLRPWQPAGSDTVAQEASWHVLEPVRMAVLDGTFTRGLALYPELAAALFERAIRRSRDLATNLAIASQTRVEMRLELLLWQLASRWGRVRADGVLVPIRLTHAVLADLVAARRPTVTSALSELAARGRLAATDEGWLLHGEPPGAHSSTG